MKLSSAYFSTLNSTIVRFIILLLLVVDASNAAENEAWRRDSVREQQVAERIYQWQKRGHFTLQYCWQALRIDDRASRSRPDQHLLAAHSDLSDAQLRADYVRQQWFCLIEQNPALRAVAVERLRRRLPTIRITEGTLTAQYSELLAAQMALQWLRNHGEEANALSAQHYWQQGIQGQNYTALFTRVAQSNAIAQHFQQQLLPATRQLAAFGIDTK